MELRSPAFEPEGQIPEKYSRDRDNISPPLEWSDVPAAAKELDLPPGADRESLIEAMSEHLMEEAALRARYERPRD